MGQNDEISDAERQQIINKIGALARVINQSSIEMADLIAALKDTKARVRKEVDEFGDPTYRFKVRVVIPDDIKLTRKMRDYAGEKGFNATTVQPVWEAFVGYYRSTKTKWADWTAVWQKWVRTEAERRATGQVRSSRDLNEL